MNMRLEEKNILDEMKKIRFLKNGIEEVEMYEALNEKIREYNDIECIPNLCELMEDDVNECSAVESVLETILILAKNNESEKALEKIISSIMLMEGHGDSWARVLHTQILKDREIRDLYIECVKKADNHVKEKLIVIYERLRVKKRIKDFDMDSLIESIR